MGRQAHEIAVRVTGESRQYQQQMRTAVRTSQEFERAQTAMARKHETAQQRVMRVRREAIQQFRRTAREQIRLEKKVTREAEKAVEKSRQLMRRRLQMERQAAQKSAQIARRSASVQRQSAISGLRGGIMSRGGGMVRGALGMAGIFGFTQLMQDTRSFESTLTDMMITGQKDRRWVDETRNRILEVSKATGKSKTEVASFLQNFITQTGDATTGVKVLRDMGEVALATGANMESLASVFVKLSGAMGIAGKDAKQAFNIIRGGELVGSMTMSNIAATGSGVFAQSRSFGKAGMGLAGLQALSGLMQISARGFDPSQPMQTANAARMFLVNLAAKRKKVEKALGIKGRLGRMGAKGFEWNALPDVFRTIGEAAARDPSKFAKVKMSLFGRSGMKTAEQIQQAAQAGWTTSSGAYAAASTVFAAGGQDVIAKQAAQRRASEGYKWKKAMADLSAILAKVMLPVLKQIVKIMPTFAKTIKFLLENSRAVIALWLGVKGAAFFRTLAMGAGGGSAAGAGVAAGGSLFARAGGARSLASGLFMGAAMAPFAYEIGVKLGEWAAGTTMAAIEQAKRDIEEQKRLTEQHKQWRLKKEAIIPAMSAWYAMPEGYRAGKRADKLLATAGAQIFGDYTGRGQAKYGITYSPGALISKLGGTQKAESFYEKLKASYGTIRAQMNRVAGKPLTDIEAIRRDPRVAQLKLLMEHFGKAITQARKDQINIIAPPAVVVAVHGMGAGDRANAASSVKKMTQQMAALAKQIKAGLRTQDENTLGEEIWDVVTMKPFAPGFQG